MSNVFGELWKSIITIFRLLLDVRAFWKGVCTIIRALCRLICRIVHREYRCKPRGDECCLHLPSDVYKRPDPLVYAQYYLMKAGLAVTWDNPDIDIFEKDPTKPNGLGTPVSPWLLQPARPYRVRVRVWNGSFEAPAVGLPVHLWFLNFGVATTTHPIGTTHVDLGIKGSAEQPVFGYFDWVTPGAAGHYCLQTFLQWNDDANPENNLGQENVNVGVAASPAVFEFPVRNNAFVRRRFVMEADAYTFPKPPPCDELARDLGPIRPRDPDRRQPTRRAESEARWRYVRQRQTYGMFPVPPDWSVVIEPREFTLSPQEERIVTVSIEPKAPNTKGPQAFNMHAFATGPDNVRTLAGGVTLTVTKA
jgi:hypothetical protein